MKLDLFLARVRVFLTAAVTYLVAVAAILPLIAGDLAQVLPEGTAQDVGEVVIVIVAWIGAAISIIRRVTPVLPEDRGLL